MLSYVRTYGFPALITRSSNNYGPYQFPEKFLPLMITNAFDDKPLPIYGDGKQQRDWLHVEDNCRGVLAVLERGSIGEVYNIGGLDVEENLTIARRSPLDRQAGILALLREGPSRPRPPLCARLRKDRERPGMEARHLSTRVCGRPSIGTRATPTGWPEFAAAHIAPITKNITKIATPRSMRFHTNGAERCKISFHR